jgi:hypothetical protein
LKETRRRIDHSSAAPFRIKREPTANKASR